MKIKKFHLSLFLTVLVVLVVATPVLAMSPVQVEPADPFAALTAIFTALAAATGIGTALAFLIQIGKMFKPNWFPDSSAQNWRLGTILFLTLVVYFVPILYPPSVEWLNVLALDSLAKSFAEFGSLIMPLFVALADWIAKKFYQVTLRGTFVGKSWTQINLRGSFVGKGLTK